MSFTLGYLQTSVRAIFHAFCTIHDRERSCREASYLISRSMSSGKYRLCLRLSVLDMAPKLPRPPTRQAVVGDLSIRVRRRHMATHAAKSRCSRRVGLVGRQDGDLERRPAPQDPERRG